MSRFIQSILICQVLIITSKSFLLAKGLEKSLQGDDSVVCSDVLYEFHDKSQAGKCDYNSQMVQILTREQLDVFLGDRLSIERAVLSGVDLTGLDLARMRFHGCVLDNQQVRNILIAGGSVEQVNLKYIDELDLSDISLEGVSFVRTKLRGDQARKLLAKGANLRGVNLSYEDLGGEDLRGAKFMSAHLQGVNFRGADLRGADLRGADLRGAKLNSSNGVRYRWLQKWMQRKTI